MCVRKMIALIDSSIVVFFCEKKERKSPISTVLGPSFMRVSISELFLFLGDCAFYIHWFCITLNFTVSEDGSALRERHNECLQAKM